MDYNGYIRLNVRGREPRGIVDPAQVPAVCAEIREGLLGFRDADDGLPVVADVVRVEEIVGRDGPRRGALPDLVVLWHRRHSAQASSGVVSERHGEIRWPCGAPFGSGRSGNHTDHGWFVAAGPGIERGRAPRAFDTIDLMPTVFEWLEAPRPGFFQGRPIDELSGAAAAVS
jgi:predicted AlkP superfamily phosphohydrolase/phosphomutase